MLDDLLRNKDVLSFTDNIKTSDRYFNKKSDKIFEDSIYVSNEVALFIFYDALLKYKIIIDDINLFNNYLDNLDKLYRKIDSFQKLRESINKLICKLVILKLGIDDGIYDKYKKNEVIKYIYDKYIDNGYYIHGFSTTYVDDILKNGFIPEKYENYYENFIKLRDIFSKYNVINVIDKDFNKKRVVFTDDLVKGCYYSTYSPLYFYRFLINEDYFGKRYRKDSYLKGDYLNLISPLKRFMCDNLFSDGDKKYVLSLIRDEWDLLHRVDKKISLLLVKRNIIDYKSSTINDYLNDNGDLFEVVDRLLSSKNNNVYYDKILENDSFEIINLDNYCDEVFNIAQIEEQERKEKEELERTNNNFLNSYGKTSYMLLFGSLFISLGVIVTIFMIWRGQ